VSRARSARVESGRARRLATTFSRDKGGNVEITVPATLAVECRGTPVFGSFASLARLPAMPAGEAILRIVGSAVFGNVEVRTRPLRALLP
jgi:hypothetical protein